MELAAGTEAISPVPKALFQGDAFEERIHHAHDARGGDELRPELGALRDAAEMMAGIARRGRSAGRRTHQLVAALGRELLGADEEMRAIGHALADQKYTRVDTEKSTRIFTTH